MNFSEASSIVSLSSPVELRGMITDVAGTVIEATGPFVSIGSQVEVRSGLERIPAQVVGFKKNRMLLMPFSEPQGISPGAMVAASAAPSSILASDNLLGRVIDPFGNPIDGRPLRMEGMKVPLYRDPPNPVKRSRITEAFDTGIRALNTFTTLGLGQRVGIMAGSGVGKSTLLGMIAKFSSSDVNIIGLIGERGREVREFLERDLGSEGLKRSVVVVATGNESALLRIRAAYITTALAEYFRDRGKKVVLMMDSVTRLAMAQREIGLAVGEPPSTKGYTPSVFAMLPKLLERAGTCEGSGTITGIYTVLVEGDDMNEPIADSTRGILDGHIILSRRLAAKGQYPSVEVNESVSRVMGDLLPQEAINLVSDARDIIATYKETEDLITIGAYKAGQNTRIDRAVKLYEPLMKFLKQGTLEATNLQDSWKILSGILAS